MNKRGLVVFGLAVVFTILLLNGVLAANETARDNADKGYNRLSIQTDEKNLSLQEATFALMALGNDGNLVDTIEKNKDSAGCWPKGACKVKETSQVVFAYNRIGRNTDDAEKWLLTKNGTSGDLKWILQIDITNKVAAECTINDGERDTKIKIKEDSKLQGPFGACFSLDGDGYRLKINSNCLEKKFTVSCDQDFVTSTLYQKNIGQTLFVLPETHSSTSLGTTREEVNGQCFRSGTICDYEGSLWTVLALQKVGENVSKYTPYLLAIADDNVKYFPSSFLYIIVGGEDQYNLIIQQQKDGKFWDIPGSPYGRFYDTGLALFGLGANGGAEADAAREYLSEIQATDGGWNNGNIRDTAFVLYSVWPKQVPGVIGSAIVSCESNPPFSCGNIFDCNQAGGIIQSNYYCGAGASCCSVTLTKPSCAQKQGLICEFGTECNGRVESSSDGSCCLDGACVESQIREDTCTAAGGRCGSVCANDETESSSETCSLSGESCCIPQSGSSLWFWIIFLLILIALVVLAIIYRTKLVIWAHQIREKLAERFEKKSLSKQEQPQRTQFQQMGRPMMQQRPFIHQRAPVRTLPKDREMEEALKRLRDMSKK